MKAFDIIPSKTSDIAGDGTTTATVLARSLFKEGIRNIVAGSNPAAIRRGIEKAVDAAEAHLVSMSKPVSSKDEIANVGAISANNDMSIGDELANALEKVGKDGVITVEEGKTRDTTVEFVDGMQFDKGYISPYFISNPAEMECELENAVILIFEKKISNLRDLVPLLEKVAKVLAGDDFHDVPQHITRDAVIEACSWLVEQRDHSQLFDHILQIAFVESV